LNFHLYPLRFFFVAREPVHFPLGKAANLLRGAFGSIFSRIACVPHCPGPRECEIRAECPYARMFEPSALAPGPSGLADSPRPFVFRATHLDGHTITPGGAFFFDLNLFDMHSPAIRRDGDYTSALRFVIGSSCSQLVSCVNTTAYLYLREWRVIRPDLPG
jgi:hypothetical protein